MRWMTLGTLRAEHGLYRRLHNALPSHALTGAPSIPLLSHLPQLAPSWYAPGLRRVCQPRPTAETPVRLVLWQRLWVGLHGDIGAWKRVHGGNLHKTLFLDRG